MCKQKHCSRCSYFAMISLLSKITDRHQLYIKGQLNIIVRVLQHFDNNWKTAKLQSQCLWSCVTRHIRPVARIFHGRRLSKAPGPGACYSENFWNLRSSNCWKYIKIVNPSINTLFFFSFWIFYDPIRWTDLFGSWGVEAACAPHPPPGLRACKYFGILTNQFSRTCGKQCWQTVPPKQTIINRHLNLNFNRSTIRCLRFL